MVYIYTPQPEQQNQKPMECCGKDAANQHAVLESGATNQKEAMNFAQ